MSIVYRTQELTPKPLELLHFVMKGLVQKIDKLRLHAHIPCLVSDAPVERPAAEPPGLVLVATRLLNRTLRD